MPVRIVIFLFFVAVTPILTAQQDPEARKILDRSAEKTKAFSTIQADFQLIISNRIEDNESVSDGRIIIKDDKYYIEMMGSQIFYNGKTMWSYTEEIKEVTITEPDRESDDFLENPARLFTWYNRDFKYNLDEETSLNGEEVYVINLFPENLNQPYSRIRLFISKDDQLIKRIISAGKEGIDYIFTLSNIKTDIPVKDTQFEFDPSEYKQVEVIDLRF